MVTGIKERVPVDDKVQGEATFHPVTKSSKSESQLLLSNKFITHSPKAGLNSLVDGAAYLFSIMGKLKQLKSYRHLSKLRKELIREINAFQDVAKNHGYSSEYILVTRYALCATFDDIISNTTWGAQSHWNSHTLLSAFNQDSINQDRFFAILERLIKDPHLYIDVMEFMYICLSMGFKGQYRSTEFNNNQLEQIINSLYKRIRAYRGDFSKILSPFPLKPANVQKSSGSRSRMPGWLLVLFSVGISLAVFAGIRFMLNVTSTQAYQDLTRMGKAAIYERDHQTS
jgi:type VI secretion system protein ImpK